MKDDLEIKTLILAEIKKHDTIILLRHKHPDGDCIGAVFGLREILRASFPQKRIYAFGDPLPHDLAFMGKEDELLTDLKGALAIVLDTSVRNRIVGDIKNCDRVIKIDHHLAADDFGDLNYVDGHKPSCCEMVYDFVKTFPKEFVLNAKAAAALFTGIVTDTGRFRFESVRGDTLKKAGELLDQKIPLEDIYTHLYAKDKKLLMLEGYILRHFKVTAAGVAYIHLTDKIIDRFLVEKDDAANLINSLNNVKGSLIWIFFIDYGREIRVRLRSRYLPIVDVAEKFHGGGHANASGATLYKESDIRLLLKAADLKLKTYKLTHPEKF